MAGREMEFEAALTAEQAAEFLERLARLLREGKGTLKAGKRSVVLRPPQTLLLEVEAGTAPGKGWLELELEWQEPGNLAIEPGVEEEEWDEEDWEEEEEEWEDEDEVWCVEEEEDADEEEEKGNGGEKT